MSPASEQPDGSPIIEVKNIPPQSDWNVTSLDEPQIYYGEMRNKYVIVKASGLTHQLIFPNNKPLLSFSCFKSPKPFLFLLITLLISTLIDPNRVG